MAETEAQQIALLANTSLLADELLPRAAMKLASVNHAGRKDEPPRRASEKQNRIPEQRECKRQVQRSVDRLRDSFCRQHALDLIFTEDGDTHLSADMYTSKDGHAKEHEWFPSPIFQFYLDMKFVILFTSQGRYLSRNLLQVINNIIARAVEAFSATGVDPNSVLPEDDWVAELSQGAIEMLSGDANQDIPSPTASISAQSISSVVSH